MKKLNKTGPMRLRRVIGNLLTQRRIIPILAVAAGLLPVSNAFGTEINLVTPYPGSGSFASGTSPGGAGAIYSTIDSHPTGTGVFDPFLSYQAKSVEEGFNTSSGGNGQGFLDTKRVPQWNHDLFVGDLAPVTLSGKSGTFYAFELDANETGNGNAARLLSIDDIRIYTSASDTANSVGDTGLVDNLGTLRYAQNASLGVTANWVLIDASKKEGGSTSGSGSSDMIVYVPTALFAGASTTDFLYFYTINGVNNAADAGYEEWAAYTATGVPDGGSTLLLLGSSLTALGFLAGRRGLADHS
jgi:hypothetical protein